MAATWWPNQKRFVVAITLGVRSPAAVAASIDAEDWSEVVGTLAGDDTILVISQDNKTAHQLARRIEGMLA